VNKNDTLLSSTLRHFLFCCFFLKRLMSWHCHNNLSGQVLILTPCIFMKAFLLCLLVNKLHLFGLTQHRLLNSIYFYMCATCFGLYWDHPETCQYTHFTKGETKRFKWSLFTFTIFIMLKHKPNYNVKYISITNNFKIVCIKTFIRSWSLCVVVRVPIKIHLRFGVILIGGAWSHVTYSCNKFFF
jgi:hypothetical protein